MNPSVVIIGGGLAGLVGSIQLATEGVDVLLIEKKDYPRHKVCGEYVSNEVLPYLKRLGINPFEKGAKAMSRMALSAPDGRQVDSPLPLGAFSISRYAFDELLYQKAQALGVEVWTNTTVQHVRFQEDYFEVECLDGSIINAAVVLGCFGKRSVLDKRLSRPFTQEQAPYVGVKYHIAHDFPENLVALHNFEGGYCGLSQVETGHVNLCYLVHLNQVQRHSDLDVLEKRVLCKNPHLRSIIEEGEMVFEKRLVISNISFRSKRAVQNHILFMGDAAGLISPLCGNGMAMAIHGAKIGAELTLDFLHQRINREELEYRYQKAWRRAFGWRLRAGRYFQHWFNQPFIAHTAMSGLRQVPGILPFFIRQTHGKLVV